MTTAAAAGDRPAATPGFVLDVGLTVAPQLPAVTRSTLINEAERIWAHERVHLRWRVPTTEALPDAQFRVLVIPRPPISVDEKRWAVGELVALTQERALAIASIIGARRVLSAARGRVIEMSDDDLRLGLVLGRAVAHEIGHYLLDTRTHATRGLMRAGFDPREFADVRAATTFVLDEDASRWVRQRLLRDRSDDEATTDVSTLPAPWFSMIPATAFSYVER